MAPSPVNDLLMLDATGSWVQADTLFTATKSMAAANEFSAKVPKSILRLTELAESLFQPSDEAWQNSYPAAQQHGQGGERTIGREQLLSLRSCPRPHPAAAKMPTLAAKPMSWSGMGKRSPHLSKASGMSSIRSNSGCRIFDSVPEKDTDVSSEEEEMSEDEDVEVIIGPSNCAFSPMAVTDLPLPDAREQQAPIRSCAGSIYYSDIQRLTRARPPVDKMQPLSFGSALHLNGHTQKCRPCLFERAPGRCRRLWLCDFCHMHEGRRHKAPGR